MYYLKTRCLYLFFLSFFEAKCHCILTVSLARTESPSFLSILFLPSYPIQSPSLKFSKKLQTISRNFQFSIRLKSWACALDAIESNPTGNWAFGNAQNLPVRLQDGFQKTPSKLSSPNRPNQTSGNRVPETVEKKRIWITRRA